VTSGGSGTSVSPGFGAGAGWGSLGGDEEFGGVGAPGVGVPGVPAPDPEEPDVPHASRSTHSKPGPQSAAAAHGSCQRGVQTFFVVGVQSTGGANPAASCEQSVFGGHFAGAVSAHG
jgi:hypothetical protein